jgi:endonuclease YncB( thermonuclease family)
VEGLSAGLPSAADKGADMPIVRLIPIVAFLACSSTVLYAGDIEGRAKPIDGDSFNIEIRIFGIDAPEPGQTCKDAEGFNYPCGRIARDAMAELLKGKTVLCEKQGQDTKYGRPVVVCYSDGLDVGAEMVDRGLAVAYRRYSLKYVPNEEQAKAAKRGLWAGTFETPREYRARAHFWRGQYTGGDPERSRDVPAAARPASAAVRDQGQHR